MKSLPSIIIIVGLTTGLFALEDTPANRTRLAERLIQTFPMHELWASVERQITQQQREQLTVLFRYFNWKTFTKSIKQILIETYTADEIKALTDAYNSPVGRSILKKQGSSFLSAAELRTVQEFCSSPIGQSIMRKQRIYFPKLKPILAKEFVKAWNKMREEAEVMRQSKLAVERSKLAKDFD